LYQDLREVVLSTPKDDKLIIFGVFNARVGSNHEVWDCLGLFGTGKVNDNGLLFYSYVLNYNILLVTLYLITRTFTKFSKNNYIIDYAITRMQSIRPLFCACNEGF